MRSVSQAVPFQHSKLFVRKLNPIVPTFTRSGLPAVFQEGILFWAVAIEVFCPTAVLLKITAFLDSTGFSLPGISSTAEGLAEGDALGDGLADCVAEGDGEADLPPGDGETEGLIEGEALSAADGETEGETDGDSVPADGEALGE